MVLLNLQQGQKSKLIKIDKGISCYDRLLELGFTTGEDITILRRATLGGPLQIKIRDTSYAIRRDEAAFITVSTDL
ncbi:ferrous iron transport protein A [bacterium]|nr:ferrous iron transport protein A [bacterium]